jgi:hypothetical protein
MMKLRKLKEAGHVSIMGKRRTVHRLQVGNVKERDHLGRVRGRWEYKIKRTLNKWDGRA